MCVHIPCTSQVDHERAQNVCWCADVLLVYKALSLASGAKDKTSADDGAGDTDSIGQTDAADARTKR